MLSGGKDALDAAIDDEQKAALERLEDEQIDFDAHGFDIAFQIQSRNSGTGEEEIKERDIFDHLMNDDSLNNAIAMWYLFWRTSSGPDVGSEWEYLDHIQTKVEAHASDYSSDINTTAEFLSNEDVNSQWAIQCITLLSIIEDS
jgi:hypothetical protein